MCEIQFLKSPVVVCQVPIKEKMMSVTTEMEICRSHKFRRQDKAAYIFLWFNFLYDWISFWAIKNKYKSN